MGSSPVEVTCLKKRFKKLDLRVIEFLKWVSDGIATIIQVTVSDLPRLKHLKKVFKAF